MKVKTMTEAERLRKMAAWHTRQAAHAERGRPCSFDTSREPAGEAMCFCGRCCKLAATACVRLAETMENGVTR